MTLACVPLDFASASDALERVHAESAELLAALSKSLASTAGMAGTDQAGSEWADAYDDGAAIVSQACSDLVAAAGQTSLLLHASGANHAEADSTSTPGGRPADYPPPPGVSAQSSAPTLPSASGGESGGGPPGWSFVADAVGFAWPNGHQDRLRDAGATWSYLSRSLPDAGAACASGVSLLEAQQSPEIPDAIAVCREIGEHLSGLSDGASVMARACDEYAAHLDQAHGDLIRELNLMLRDQAVVTAIGLGLTVFTVGASDVVAAGIDSTRLAAAVAKIRSIVLRLVDAAREASTLVRSALDAIRRISAELALILRETPRSALAWMKNELPPLRQEYVNEVRTDLPRLLERLRAEGKGDEEMARAMNQARRDIGGKYKELTPIFLRKKIFGRNMEKYGGDMLGPTVELLHSRNLSWNDIIESSIRTGGQDLGF